MQMPRIHFGTHLTIIWTSTCTNSWPRTNAQTGELEEPAEAFVCWAFSATAALHKVFLLLQLRKGVYGKTAASLWLPKFRLPAELPNTPACDRSVGQRRASSSPSSWGDGRSCWFTSTPPAQPVLLLLVEITTSSDLPAERLVWTPPNLLWSTWARLSLNGLSRRFLLTQFDWSGLRGTHTSISANTSWEGINSWEKATASGWDYQTLLLTQLNQESTQRRLHNFRDGHELTLQTAEVTVSHQLPVAAFTTAQGAGDACYSFTSASWQGSPARKVQTSALQQTRSCSCLPFCRLNWEGGNFHLIWAET